MSSILTDQASAETRDLAWISRALDRDYFPILNRHLNRFKTPLCMLCLSAIASTLCALVLNPALFLVAGAILAVIALGLVWPWLSLAGVSATLRFERDRAREGETVWGELLVRNAMPWSALGLSLDSIATEADANLSSISTKTDLARAPGWRTSVARLEFTCDRRGVFPKGKPRIRTGFPFGLISASRPLSVASELIVWPVTFPVGPLPEPARGRDADGLSHRDRVGNTGDMLGVRPYRRGDSVRRIHWPQTARHNQLVVCELHTPSLARVQVVIDVSSQAHVGLGLGGSFEWSIRVAASYAEAWLGRGAAVELVFGQQRLDCAALARTRRKATLLDALARLDASGGCSLEAVLGGRHCLDFQNGIRVVVATDLSLDHLQRRRSSGVGEHFVVLRAREFSPEPSQQPALENSNVRPWLIVDDALRVPETLLKG